MKKKWMLYGGVHIALIGLALMFPFYQHVIEWVPERLRGCALHDIFFVYCPVCGGTRAIQALLSFDLVAAWHHNAYVMLLVLVAWIVDLYCLICLIRKKTVRLPVWFWISLVVSALLWAILRNVLMIGFGVDPTGDLGCIWN